MKTGIPEVTGKIIIYEEESIMVKCRITVLKRIFNADLAGELCGSATSYCPCLEEGQVFDAGFEKPEGFCGWAWNDILKYVTVLLAGGNFSRGIFEGWMSQDNVMIASCTDGIRPVVFKLERIEE